jgi:hypothetical protein
LEVPRHELIDLGGGVALGDGFEGCLEIGEWLDGVELAGLD